MSSVIIPLIFKKKFASVCVFNMVELNMNENVKD